MCVRASARERVYVRAITCVRSVYERACTECACYRECRETILAKKVRVEKK